MAYRTPGLIPMPQPQPVDPIGQIMGLADLGRMDRQIKRESQGDRDQQVIRSAHEEAGGDMDATLAIVKSKAPWLVPQVEASQANHRESIDRATMAAHERLIQVGRSTSDELEKMMQLPPDAQMGQWPRYRERIVRTMPEQMASRVPLDWDANWAREEIPGGRLAAELAETRNAIIAKSRERKGQRSDIDEEQLPLLAQALATSEDAEDWNGMLQYWRQVRRVSPKGIALFGEYSPESPARAASLFGAEEQTDPALQQKTVTVDGREVLANFNPNDGRLYDPSSGQEIANAQPTRDAPPAAPQITPSETRQREQNAIAEFRESLKLSVGAVGQGRDALLTPGQVQAQAEELGLNFGVELERAARDAHLDELNALRTERTGTMVNEQFMGNRAMTPEETEAARQRMRDRTGALRDGYANLPVAEPTRGGGGPAVTTTPLDAPTQ